VIFLRTRLCPSVFPNIRAAALFAGYIYHIFILLLYIIGEKCCQSIKYHYL
jgi:hypothetical protein